MKIGKMKRTVSKWHYLKFGLLFSIKSKIPIFRRSNFEHKFVIETKAEANISTDSK